ALEVLSPQGDLAEAARHLFAALRRLDAGAAELIVAEIFPQEGLGAAINDRLKRAAARRDP
ncbi:MAG TPA: Sua5 family C-terminal domain-containing protein, partial [Flavobacteriales bacterium]|nr:Sua5 family C-terminal domain-containing protein [Flavobacteriales bacterium]